MDKAKFQAAEQHFKTIRDERGLRQNTATRIGTAFLELLYLLEDTSQEELDRFKESPIFEKGLISLAAIILGNYVKGQSGGSIDEKGDAELNDLTLRGDAIIPSILESTVFRKGLLTLGKILFGNYVEGESGGYIDENGNGELESLVVRSGMTIDKFLNQPTFVNGLITLGNILIGEYAEGLKGGLITPEAYAELKELYIRETAKLGRLKVEGDSVFNGNLSSPDFVSEFLGGLGWAIQKQEVENAAGEIETKYSLEIDNATIRGTLRVFEMIISQLLGENGNRFFSDMMEVDHYDSSTGRIWLDTQNGKLYNPFRVGDIIMVQQYNGEPAAENNWYVTKAYELRITGVGIGEQQGADRLDWVTFDNFTTTVEGLTPETAITKGDTLVRADNETNKNRKGLLTIMSVGENTPYMDILYGLKTDPKHALKGRTGNLEGIITDIFGSLEGFGAYLNNLYAVGKFFNAQTGESINARIEGTKASLRSVYSETIYNIPEDENFISNGFFQHGLNNWTACNVDGSAATAEASEVLGLNSSPLLINGLMINAKSKKAATIEVVDGISMLHLRSMGIAQQFSVMKANGSHKVMNSSSDEDTTTRTVADTLYMGIRILPSTSGTLKVSFVKEDGTTTGWERDITSSTSWQLQQAQDYEELPWNYDGNGRLIISYTGECYIRFVALRADAISNTKVEYSTLFEQTSRRITLQASKQTADLNEAVAELTLTAEGIRTTVTNNKTAADNAFKTLTDDLDAEVSARQGLENTYKATWVYQNDSLISLMAAQFNADGTIKGYSDLQLRVDGISTTVTNNKTAADNAFKKLTDDLDAEVSARQGLENTYKATWVYQNDSLISLMAAQFNADGTIKGFSNLQLRVDGISTTVTNNKTATDKALKDLADDLAAESDQNDTRADNLAGWQELTAGRLDTIEGRWDSDGNLKGYSKTSQLPGLINTEIVKYGYQTADDVTSRLTSYYNKTETDGKVSMVLGRIITSNLLTGLKNGSGWTYDDFYDGSCTFVSADYYVISPTMQLPAGTYTISADFMSADAGGVILFDVIDASDGSLIYNGSLDCGTYEPERSSDTFTLSAPARVRLSFDADYCESNFQMSKPKLECGENATPWSVESDVVDSRIDMTREAITLQLQNSGINLTNQSIELLAGKVTFGYYDNGTKKTDKIWIDTSTGTLHAVDGDFSGKITATEGTIGGFSIGGNYIGSAEYSNRLWGGLQLYKDGRLYMGNDEYNYALRGNGGFEWVGNGKDITLSAVTGSVYNHGNVVLAGYLKFAGLPTSSSGLTSGEVYRDGNTLKIV